MKSFLQKTVRGNFINESFAKLYENMDKYSLKIYKKVKILVGEYALQGEMLKQSRKRNLLSNIFLIQMVMKKKTSKYGTLKFK